jgi:protein O-mannosyl-transferase
VDRNRFLPLGAALAAFGLSLGSGFHFDDYAIFSDPALTSPGGWLHIWGLRQTRPLTYLTYWLNYQAGGTNPLGYHAVNLLLHLAAVLLAYECLRRLLPARAAWLAAAIFAVHPLQAESVDYIWGRSMVLAAMLCFACLLAWTAGRPWLALACFAAALAAKEECAAFPLVLALLWRLPGQANRLPRQRRAVAAMLLLSLVAGVRVVWAAAVTPGAQASTQAGITPANYFLAQGVVTLRYLRMLVVPWGFTVDPEIPIPPVWLGALAWAALLSLAALAWRRRAPWGVWLLAGFALLLPSSSVFPAADLAADRRMYLPIFAFAAAASSVLAERAWKWTAPTLVLALLAVSIFRTQVWNSDEALWREALARAPDKVRPRIQLSRDVPLPEALRLLHEARQLAPGDAAIAAETGKTLLAAGDAAAALGEFGRALALDPRDAANYNNRGVALAALGQTEAARRDFQHALALAPGLTSAAENLRKMEGR